MGMGVRSEGAGSLRERFEADRHRVVDLASVGRAAVAEEGQGGSPRTLRRMKGGVRRFAEGL